MRRRRANTSFYWYEIPAEARLLGIEPEGRLVANSKAEARRILLQRLMAQRLPRGTTIEKEV